ncbi:MAG: hypothetical protein H6948_01170 [Zoogloeaceae bacterium]|nr:hypothetical protein [Zoogloeaceae bacterium]
MTVSERADRLADMYMHVADPDQTYDLGDLVLSDRSAIADVPEYSALAASVDAYWRQHADEFDSAMTWWHNDEMRALYRVDQSHWWWYPITRSASA